MRHLLKLTPLCVVIVIATACGDTKSNPEEEQRINTMDSVSRAVKDSTERLREQTSRVEESLEKLNKEFETENSNKN